ncbi:MAG: hypothetical protein JW751_10375, partial [Polyangiaceae bacterium]|nr:hypothetical protein [Polyangiaceae bacterium]
STPPPPLAPMTARARRRSLKYILRPPLAQDRVTLVAGDLVRLTLKRPFSDGTVALALDPLSPSMARGSPTAVSRSQRRGALSTMHRRPALGVLQRLHRSGYPGS